MLMVASTVDEEWQAGRNRFNHDWMKNKFLLSLDRLVNIADDKIEDEEYANRFLSSGLLDWQAEAAKAEELIESFETAMSPQTYMDREPLCRSSHREWLRIVVHALWRSRIHADELLSTAREKLLNAKDAYEAFRKCAAENCGKMDCDRLACCRSELVAFRDGCRELATAFEKFPHRVLVT